jgi:hypothetical protein
LGRSNKEQRPNFSPGGANSPGDEDKGRERDKALMTDTKSLENSFDSAEGTVPVAQSEWGIPNQPIGKGPSVDMKQEPTPPKGEGPDAGSDDKGEAGG